MALRCCSRLCEIARTKEIITITKSLLSPFLCVVLILFPSFVILAQQVETPTVNDVQTLARSFVTLLSREDFSAATKNFDATMSAALPPERLQQTWKSLFAQVGAFKSQLGVRREKVQVYDVVFVSCEFATSPLDVKVVFNSAKQIAGLFFVPTQAKPETHEPSTSGSPNGKEVLIGSGEWALHGTVTLPNGAGPFPALVLVHGSGPHDRDETIGPNKPFRDLSDGLVAKEIAVLRYEKRTKEHAGQLAPLRDSLTTKEETVDDALLAVALLRNMERIDPKKIFVLGHSLGGTLIPRIGTLDPGIAGLIVMAGTSRPLEEVILSQMSYIFSLDSTLSESEKSQLNEIKSQVAR